MSKVEKLKELSYKWSFLLLEEKPFLEYNVSIIYHLHFSQEVK